MGRLTKKEIQKLNSLQQQ